MNIKEEITKEIEKLNKEYLYKKTEQYIVEMKKHIMLNLMIL